MRLLLRLVCLHLTLLPIGLEQHLLLIDTYWGKALVIAILATAIPYALDLMALKRFKQTQLWEH